MDRTPDSTEADPTDNVIMLPGVDPASALGPTHTADVLVPDEVALENDDAFSSEQELQPPPPELLEAAVEALLLAADGPLTTAQLDRFLAEPGTGAVDAALRSIQARMGGGFADDDRRPHGIVLVQVAKGWQLRTHVRMTQWVANMRGGRPLKLSRAALEVISIVAYRQPITKAEIEDLRGVDSGGVIRTLVERELLQCNGHADEPGRPLLYCTSKRFLEVFGLRDLSDLPHLADRMERAEPEFEDPSDGEEPDLPLTMEQIPLPLLAPGATRSAGLDQEPPAT